MVDPFAWIDNELAQRDAANLRRARRRTITKDNGRIEIDGTEYWNFAGNDYLNLANDSRLRASAVECLQETGIGATASPLVVGRSAAHVELEAALCALKRTEAAIVFPTGYAANVGTITSLVGSGDPIFCDRLNHASIIDGCRQSKATLRVIRHNDVEQLETELQKSASSKRKLIVTDALFSMDGDRAPLIEQVALAEQNGAMLLVDEAHSTGILGPTGAGLIEELGIDSSHVIAVGTLSKALGCQGGFVTGTRSQIEWLWNSARPHMFSTALALPVCNAASRAVSLVPEMNAEREWLRDAWNTVCSTLRAQGWNVPATVNGPIVPVIIGDDARTMELTDELKQRGLFVAGIRPPTVSIGTSRLRISLSVAHGDVGVTALLDAFSALAPTS